MPRLNITEEEQLKNLNGVPTPKKTKGEKMNRQEQILAEESKPFHEQKKKQMGELLSIMFEWNGADILDICQIALEDSNYHTLNNCMTSLRRQQKIESDWNYCKHI